jgi:hypothetical protein
MNFDEKKMGEEWEFNKERLGSNLNWPTEREKESQQKNKNIVSLSFSL